MDRWMCCVFSVLILLRFLLVHVHIHVQLILSICFVLLALYIFHWFYFNQCFSTMPKPWRPSKKPTTLRSMTKPQKPSLATLSQPKRSIMPTLSLFNDPGSPQLLRPGFLLLSPGPTMDSRPWPTALLTIYIVDHVQLSII